MSATNVFAPAHGASNPFATLGLTKKAKKEGKGRKRVTNDEDTHHESIDSALEVEDEFRGFSSRAGSVAESYTSLTANQLAEYKAAGLEPGEEIPPFPFPHRSTSPRRNTKSAVENGLRDLKSRLAHVEQTEQIAAETDSLREQHLGVLTAVLHKMLLEGDWQRAGRAWGLLLRSGHMAMDSRNRKGYKSMDVRTNDRWGIGAEILLRGGMEDPSSTSKGDSTWSNDPNESLRIKNRSQFSESGFSAARQYYERLIVQFPPHHRSKGIRAGTFYTAMFSLWIFEVVEKRKQAIKQLLLETPLPRRKKPDAGANKSKTVRRSLQSKKPQREIDPVLVSPIKLEELSGAREIAERMDEVLRIRPYDTDVELLLMRGYVSKWIAGLGEERYKDDELERAQEFFHKAEQIGGEDWDDNISLEKAREKRRVEKEERKVEKEKKKLERGEDLDSEEEPAEHIKRRRRKGPKNPERKIAGPNEVSHLRSKIQV